MINSFGIISLAKRTISAFSHRVKVVAQGSGNHRLEQWSLRWMQEGSSDPKILEVIATHVPPWSLALRALRIFVPQNAEMILEVGSGTGKNCIGLAAERPTAKVIGLDPSLDAVRLGRRAAELKKTPNVAFIQGDGMKMPFANGTFDCVFSCGVLEHFETSSLSKMLVEQLRVLRQGGTLIASVPNLFNPFHFAYRIWAGDNYRYGFEKMYTAAQLRELFNALGLIDIEVGGWSLFYRLTRLYRYDPQTNITTPLPLAEHLKALGETLDRYITPFMDRISKGWMLRVFGFEIIIRGRKP